MNETIKPARWPAMYQPMTVQNSFIPKRSVPLSVPFTLKVELIRKIPFVSEIPYDLITE
jgi:hypothetical protein